MSEPITEWPREMEERDATIPESGEGHAWIQWKGTDVCMDVRCQCGHAGHVDAAFAYFYECPGCRCRFAVSPTVRLYPLAEKALGSAINCVAPEAHGP